MEIFFFSFLRAAFFSLGEGDLGFVGFLPWRNIMQTLSYALLLRRFRVTFLRFALSASTSLVFSCPVFFSPDLRTTQELGFSH